MLVSPLQEQLSRCLTARRTDAAGALTATLVCPPAFTGFQGHFPGNPVLPGVCMVQAILALLAQAHAATRIQLQAIVSAKFFAVARPDEVLTVTAREQAQADGAVPVTARIMSGTKKTAEVALQVRYVPVPGEAQHAQ
jgi:3-hydroxymyristoyl/3-hydroxydecanoyl-(acyl carrier protein) dehydratase